MPRSIADAGFDPVNGAAPSVEHGGAALAQRHSCTDAPRDWGVHPIAYTEGLRALGQEGSHTH